MKSKMQTRKLVLAAVFSALIIAMTFIPYMGYIMYAPASLEITTLHIVVIMGSICLGWKYAAVLGGVWGVSCILRAATNPLWYDFLNPLISLVPRIIVGLVAALVFAGFIKLHLNKYVSAGIAAAAGTLTNTVLVLTMYNLFGGSVTAGVYETFKTIIMTIVSINGVIELAAAVILVPLIYGRIVAANKHIISE